MIKIYEYGKVSEEELFKKESFSTSVETVVSEIVSAVKYKGDKAIRYYSEKFDKVQLEALEVS
ncbi:MAG: histidinol dehydrogenase, partial [Firmicutes bacterium]|nr:histidinol dehydrogenase [Bacillota bacterium]